MKTTPRAQGASYRSASVGTGQWWLQVVAGLSQRLWLLGGYSPIAAAGKRLVLSTGWRGKLAVIDASDVEAPEVVRETDTIGSVHHLTVVGDTALASMGMDGVQVIPLRD